MGCEAQSWEPEVYEFYGDGNTVLEKLNKIDMDLPHRRLYLFSLETPDSAELRVFEKEDDEKVSVDIWEDGDLGDLRERIHDAILANRGVACVGEQTRALVAGAVEARREAGIPRPVSPYAAFAHSLQRHGDEFVRAAVFLMC
ncbi:MAG TPA: hypothetical protein VL979_10930 [Solirubrobacteraceae bacterium]|nr:hypothetical protein [Solirubrobacteraceae bacterium]